MSSSLERLPTLRTLQTKPFIYVEVDSVVFPINLGSSGDLKELNVLWVAESDVKLFKADYNAVTVVCWAATVVFSSFILVEHQLQFWSVR